ncbi:MAG: MBL fold metallo-hydrolase [Patescibacteria group bacterium]|nr:MBL fold metallo-hydrolase [Patescibacteria group bacterium]
MPETNPSQIIVIGSGSAVIQEKRFSPSFLWQVGGKNVLFDCGWGTGLGLVRAGIKLQGLDHILISHPHADHLAGLISILHAIHVSGVYYPATKKTNQLFLHGYPGFMQDYETLRKMMFPERVEEFEIKVDEFTDEVKDYDGLLIKSCQVPHMPEHFVTVSFRVEVGDQSVVNSGDCGFNQSLINLSRKADLLVCEACIPPTLFTQGPRPNHLSPFECGQIASLAQVKRLVLTHLYDNFTEEEAKAEVAKNYSGSMILAADQMAVGL